MDKFHAGFELITIWSEKMVESSMEMAEMENASPHEAEKWLISLRFTLNITLSLNPCRIKTKHDDSLPFLMFVMIICCLKYMIK